MAEPARLRRSLGLFQLTASGVGLIIGAGIYVLLGAATDEAGGGVWLSFVVAGALSALTALSYCELAAMYPRAGAEYEYARRVAPAGVAFVVGWMMVAGLVVAAAAVALGFAAYLQRFVDLPVRVGAWGLLGVVTGIALAGIQRSAVVTVVLSAVQAGGLLAVVAIGVPHVGDHSLGAGTSLGGVVAGAALVFFAFIGFDEVITMSEETRDPSRTVPRALLLGLGISTLLYVLVAVAGVSVLGADRLAASPQPLADVAAVAIGGTSADAVAVAALLATTNTTLLVVTAGSRLLFGMASTGALPAWFTGLTRRRVPARSLVVCVAVAAGFVALGDVGLVASVTDAAVYAVFVAVNGAVIALRFWQPKRHRPFRTPLAVRRVPVLPVAGLVTTMVMLPSLDPAALVLGAAVALVGLAVHLVVRRRSVPVAPTVGPVGQDGPVLPRTKVTGQEAKAVLDALGIDLSTVEWDLEALRGGMEVELEHGRGDPDTNVTDDDLLQTAKIALAHLNELPDYYERLLAMEVQARAERES